MNIEEDYIKLIFGLKMKQIRSEKKLSLFGLSKKSGLSKSYLNEIEKGKKYPKTDKILALADALGISYDEMVSLKLDKNLAPVGELLQSNILKEIPLQHFGIKQDDLIDIIANAPLKVNTFINTLIEIAKYYNLNKENFYLVALRSFQESRNNHFPEIEQEAKNFKQQYLAHVAAGIKIEDLEEVLIEEYHYQISELDLSTYENLKDLRSIFSPKDKKLFISPKIDQAQRLFLLAKEIAYNFMNLTERPLTFSWIKYESYEEVLNNFYASYFSGALLMDEHAFEKDLLHMFRKKHFDISAIPKLLEKYQVSTETFLQRLTNILPGVFGIKNLFFLRFTSPADQLKIQLTKELHITSLHEPHAKKTDEHYCRRWVSSKLLTNYKTAKKPFLWDAQISNYPTGKSYFVLASASKDPFNENKIRSIGLGILIQPENYKSIKFLNSTQLVTENVGVTCETCEINDCDVRKVSPSKLIKQRHSIAMEKELEAFLAKENLED